MNDSIVALYKERLNLQGASFSRIEHDEAIIATVYKVSQTNVKEYILKYVHAMSIILVKPIF